jgi:hypothetical protein
MKLPCADVYALSVSLSILAAIAAGDWHCVSMSVSLHKMTA